MIKKYILTNETLEDDYDCILILGCGVRGDTPSLMLRDRLLRGIELYNSGVSGKILMSGDHGRAEYDEVNVMKNFAIDSGVASEYIFIVQYMMRENWDLMHMELQRTR